jgi:hypothetical protein
LPEKTRKRQKTEKVPKAPAKGVVNLLMERKPGLRNHQLESVRIVRHRSDRQRTHGDKTSAAEVLLSALNVWWHEKGNNQEQRGGAERCGASATCGKTL